MSTLDVAIEYRRRGLSVIPIKPKDKHPMVAWAPFQKEHASEAMIEQWFTSWPTANLGMVTGSVSDCIVIDLDSQAARDRLNSLLGDYDLSSVPRSRTGKGWQLFFKHPKVNVLNRAKVLPDMDVRGDGGYVVAPPSIKRTGKYDRGMVVETGMKDAPTRARGNMTEMAIYYYYIFYMAIFEDTHLGHLGHLGHVSHLFRSMVWQAGQNR
jgi:hypothetical protein